MTDSIDYELRLDQLHRRSLESFAAGFEAAVETFDVNPGFDTDSAALADNEALHEDHYHYWDGRHKPIENWLHELSIRSKTGDEIVTDGGTIPVCPSCGSPRYSPVVGDNHVEPLDYEYYCRDCETPFDTLETREPDRETNRRGLAGTLDKLDADAVSADDDDEIVTDGGADTVLVSSSAGHRGNTTYHRDASCRYVSKMSSVVEKPLSVIASHYDPCSVCATATDGGSAEWHGDGCPRTLCDGELVEDKRRVQCETCGERWNHLMQDGEHLLISGAGKTTKRRPINGGESA